MEQMSLTEHGLNMSYVVTSTWLMRLVSGSLSKKKRIIARPHAKHDNVLLLFR